MPEKKIHTVLLAVDESMRKRKQRTGRTWVECTKMGIACYEEEQKRNRSNAAVQNAAGKQ